MRISDLSLWVCCALTVLTPDGLITGHMFVGGLLA